MNDVVKIFVRRAEAAATLGVAVRTIDRLCERGVLRKRYLDGERLPRIVHADLVAFAARAVAADDQPSEEAPSVAPSIDELFPMPEIDKERERKRKRDEREATPEGVAA